ncbi:MAG: efflux RND transporter periplasmic adaptor subunit [Fuerstiella sp.]|jgi:multidrug efflux pump subunit AcrA (membrane-fusion protein)|nr:efflux RND transporter periplasmic adaptor subunit [Fuerstiella sp.]MCP4511211.1 efflux RND transporter periplasmic adaptor subunit [Fuerstiella sp.]MDG2129523.1 efflux RND transporter periplasmic adaptor subunit [Fuerstiella sp.]
MQDSWLNNFETRLDQLEHASTGPDVVFADVLNLTGAALRCLGTVHDISVWLTRPTGIEELRADGQCSTPSDEIQAEIAAAAEKPFFLTDAATEASSTPHVLTVSTRLADQVYCVMRVSIEGFSAPRQTFIEGAGAVVDVVGSWLSRHLMSTYESLLTAQTQLVNTIGRLHLSPTINAAASVMAQDGPAALGRCRIAVLSRRGSRYRIDAVTGVRSPNMEAETVRALEDVVNRNRFSQDPIATSEWRTLNEIDDPGVAGAVSVLQLSDVTAIRVASLTASSHAPDNTPSPPVNTSSAVGVPPDLAPAVISVEVFGNSERPNEQLLRQLVDAAGPVFAKMHRRQRTLLTRIIHGGRSRWLAAAAVLLGLLSVCPANFEIEASGQIVSTSQRRLFAPENGTIDEVRFQNEDSVLAAQILLKLSSPELELENRTVQGDIDTTTARLASVHATRLSGGDPQLSGEEAQLKQQLQNLKEQKALVEKQLASLEITAPFAGTVFRRDSQQELMSRPVQRGQLLLEIVPADSAWRLDISIPDNAMAYVTSARDSSEELLPVRYVIRSAPEHDWTTTLTSIDSAIETHDGLMTCQATALLTSMPLTNLRPGTTVTARIGCGRRSLGFVMFREVIEFWQQARFAWF